MSDKAIKFGTFGGVFTPCTLTILGVIMFLRLGHVVGQGGLLNAVMIILVAKSITVLTSLSLSAIATNTNIKGGGAYYLISRSLGLEYGGAIGVVFYLAQAIAISLYVLGFTEAMVGILPVLQNYFTEVATAVNLIVFICVYLGAGWAIRVQYVILAILFFSLFSFFLGALRSFQFELLAENLYSAYTEGESFTTMFALFFPAVTGIMAGANMSGDLKNPGRSIPLGTLSAVTVSGIIYLLIAGLLAASQPNQALIVNNLAMKDVAHWPPLVYAGILAATLSSAIGSMMGAPRILQAFARDKVFKSIRIFALGNGPSREPRHAIILTFVIAQGSLLAGELNTIAPIITMFFLITYGLLNFATYSEAISNNPSYRPVFGYCHKTLSLVGAISCLLVMFVINWSWAVVAIMTIALLHQLIGKRELEARWGNLDSGVSFERARRSLLQLEQRVYHPRNWRPIVLAFSMKSWTQPHLLVFAHWLTVGHGVLSIAQVFRGNVEDHAERRDHYERALRRFLAREEIQAFSAVIISEDLTDGLKALLQTQGIGALRPNTIFLSVPVSADSAGEFGELVRIIHKLKRSIICARFLEHRRAMEDPTIGDTEFREDAWAVPCGTIDLWWRGLDNGALMLLLAHLLQQNPGWRQNRIRMIRAIPSEQATAEVKRHIEELASAARIEVEPVTLIGDDVKKMIAEQSREAALVIMGFEPPLPGEEMDFYQRLECLAQGLPRVIFVNSAGGVELSN